MNKPTFSLTPASLQISPVDKNHYDDYKKDRKSSYSSTEFSIQALSHTCKNEWLKFW